MYERLVGNRHFQHAIAFVQHTLAAQARCEAWVARAVYEIFFFIRKLRNVVFPFFKVYMAGAAGTYHAAVVVQFYIVIEGNFQYADARFYIFYCNRFQPFLFKFECYRVHVWYRMVSADLPQS